MNRRTFFVTLTSSTVGVLGAACGAPGAQSPAQLASRPHSTQAPVTLHYVTEPGRVNSGVKDVVDAFNVRGGPIRVELEPATGSYVEAVLTRAAGGDPPDLTHTHPRDYHAWVNAGALLSLQPYLKKERQNVPDLLPTALDYWARDGQHWAVPYNLSVQNLFFNKELFAKQGLKTPDQYEKEGKWTYDVYLDLARKLTTGAGESKIFGTVWRHGNLDIQLGFIWPFGGELWDKSGEKLLLDSKEGIEAIQFQADLTAKYGVSPTDEEWRQFSSAPSSSWGAAFSAGRNAMEIQPNDSLAPHVVPAPFPKGMAPMPLGRAGRVIRGLAVGVHLLKGAKNPDAAWEFANFHTGKESEKIMLDQHVTLPWHKSSFSNLEKVMPLLPWENAAFYAEAVKRLRVTPYVGKFSDINRVYSGAYATVREGKQTAAAMMAEIKPEITSLLRP
ncbi:MAG TPA: sugar ABC transporter substrate-binding protein [Chloroflexota bacterium]|nr:sugar ABC transporter substrate-binding protein [Chloroflexota bacterium]